MKKKSVVIIASILLLATLTLSVTVAFLTDAEKTKNTFTIGEVNISLKETAVDKNGKPIAGAEPVIENEYHILPGNIYVKDPTITVEAGSADSYIRMIVTLNKYKELIEVFGEEFTPANYITDYDSEKWVKTNSKINPEENTITYEFRYYKTLNGFEDENEKDKKLEPLFTSLVVPENLSNEDFKKIAGLEIKVIGHAIQASGLETEEKAWEAFAKQYGEI